MSFLRHWLIALQFFTRIPVTGRLAAWVGYSPAMLRASAAHFPAMGWVVGGFGAAVSAGLLLALPPGPYAPLVAAALSTVATVLLTGALHEDGLADVADALGGSADRDRALEIMKDSRVGAFGALALVLALLCKVALLAILGAHGVQALCLALLLGHVLSRFWPLLVIRLLPHVGDAAGSKSKPLADAISGASLLTAFLWSIPALVLVGWAQGAMTLIAPVVLSLLAWWLLSRLFLRRLQGFTGDCLGTTQQVSEIAVYLGLALSL
ncbi:MAG: adenosylcobinamide-GDP ribazoletransferase [Comamonadaceae bacterium]|nr:MAG: adenosylcobinamide-GDP ribazoletransferase [Comamonadaceae bacterium]